MTSGFLRYNLYKYDFFWLAQFPLQGGAPALLLTCKCQPLSSGHTLPSCFPLLRFQLSTCQEGFRTEGHQWVASEPLWKLPSDSSFQTANVS